MTRLWLVPVLGILLSAAPATGQIPEGYFLVESMPELPLDTTESMVGPESTGRYSLRINRAVSPEDMPLVLLAERLFPSPGLIEAEVAESVSLGDTGNRAQSFQRMRERLGPRWWWSDFDSVLIPWAVTGHTAYELAETVRGFAAEPLPFFGEGTTVEFSYEATVTQGDDGTQVVSLTAGWRMSCGGLCGLLFEHKRIVTFDSEGGILSIDGDGRPRYIVS